MLTENRAAPSIGKRWLRLLLLSVMGSLSAASGICVAADAPAATVAGASAATVAVSAKIEAFVAAARAARPDEPIQSYLVRTMGSSEAMSDGLLRGILAGEKTGTFSLGEAPRAGEYYVVTRFDGTPALIWRITSVKIIPFDAITTADTQVEGKGLRDDIEAFRKVHMSFWAQKFVGKSREEIGATPVVAQRFVVIYPRVPVADSGK